MGEKIKVALVFGGKSPEHNVSIASALNILLVMDKEKYDIHLNYIRQDGVFAKASELAALLPEFFISAEIGALPAGQQIDTDDLAAIVQMAYYKQESDAGTAGTFFDNIVKKRYDIVFPILHGKYGEDGTLQGMLEFFDMPYVGCGVFGSAAALDKEMTKHICEANGIAVVEYITVRQADWAENASQIIANIERKLSYPVFVKPARLGSSIGITRAEGRDMLVQGIEYGLNFDNKLIVEQGLAAREIGIGVIGNALTIASKPGEYQSCNEFLDFAAKYSTDALEDIIPAKISAEDTERLQEMALAAYRALELSGLARLDFFLTTDGIYLNEINTMPGFGVHSVFTKLWQASGVSSCELIDRLITLGLERFI